LILGTKIPATVEIR